METHLCMAALEFQVLIPNQENELPSEIFDRVINNSDRVGNDGISGLENSVCPCNGNTCYDPNCLKTETYDNVYPGETITVGLTHHYFNTAMYTDFDEPKFNAIALFVVYIP